MASTTDSAVVLMMVGRDASDSVVEVLRGQRVAAAILGVGIAGLLVSTGLIVFGLHASSKSGRKRPRDQRLG